MPGLTGEEIAKHNTKESCWVIVHGKAYDVTDFLPEHPGGQKIILKYAGKDASKEFDPIHPSDTLDKYLPQNKHLGQVDLATIIQDEPESKPVDEVEIARLDRVQHIPPLSSVYNLLDFEDIARQTMPNTAWAYYSSGADDEITLRENHAAFHRIWFRPRVLVDVSHVDLTATLLGTRSSVPFYITATALGKLGNPEGEVVLTRAGYKENVIQMIPTLASCSFDEIVDARQGDQVQWLQLYVNKNRDITEKIVRHAEERGCKALWITVDAPQLGRREKDMRSKYDAEAAQVQDDESTVDRSQGAARAISSFIDPALSWKDIPWFQSITKMPIVLKGVQTAEDAIKAVEHGVDAILLSNHGGRQLEFARSAIEVLVEVMDALTAHGYQHKIEVYIDGGVRRATDIIKALCLGAKGVGIGRPFLYAMSTYGEPGVVRAIQLLKDELEMNLRLIGATRISDLNRSFVDVTNLSAHATTTPKDHLSNQAYDRLVTPKFLKSKL
ncbi:FMN-dependent dehydrogenase-domain-containing protein [Lipomyces japonicus]|uniref:FMN-dependent dehydrogenase-domain-containing protein n=1 Tax=Lipomyces japonicus TaxID=56871 RepID=UPI0034CD7926